MSEIAAWLARILAVLPQFIGLWQAAKSSNSDDHLQASLSLVRAMKDRQMKEDLETPGYNLHDSEPPGAP